MKPTTHGRGNAVEAKRTCQPTRRFFKKRTAAGGATVQVDLFHRLCAEPSLSTPEP
jgi:hypothetical protein